MKLISILILSMVLLLSYTVPAMAAVDHEEAASYGEKDIDGYKVKLTFAEGNPQVGHNQLHIKVTDPQGLAVTNASVSIVAELYDAPAETGHEGMDMPGADHSMESMGKPVQTVKVSLTPGVAGEYEGEVELNKAGSWMLNVVVGLQPQIKSVMFPVDLVKSGPNWYVLSAFFGLIVAIIVVGGLTKRKSTANVSLPEAAV